MNNNRMMNERWKWKGATTTTTANKQKSEIGRPTHNGSSHPTTMNGNRHPLRPTISQRQDDPRVTMGWDDLFFYIHLFSFFLCGYMFRSSALISARDTYFILNKWDWIIYLGIWCGRNLFSAKRNDDNAENMTMNMIMVSVDGVQQRVEEDTQKMKIMWLWKGGQLAHINLV